MHESPPLPNRIAWFAPWTWPHRWTLWQRLAMITLGCAVCCFYPLSWPIVMELTSRTVPIRELATPAAPDPSLEDEFALQASQQTLTLGIQIEQSPAALLFYRPLEYVAWETDWPVLSAGLRNYFEAVISSM
ncbi:hypothetical protein GC163_15110 [bacterium]|nr:hypothetical protein [bacterium]